MSMIAMMVAEGALIWICQPRSFTRRDRGSIISGVVAPACARLKRMPRTPSPSMRLSSVSGTLKRQVETDATHAEPVHALELGIRHAVVDDRNCARLAAESRQ